MKYYETHFEDYIQSSKLNNLHPENEDIINQFPSHIDNFKNLIIYGPSGIGKYTQSLNIIQKYSPSCLKYDKKVSICNDKHEKKTKSTKDDSKGKTKQIIDIAKKNEYVYRVSDIHYEVDMSSLGCNAKTLWHDIFFQIIDIVSIKQNKVGIILCKNFHSIYNELLDVFYSYIRHPLKHLNMKIYFILLTEHIGYIPDNILDSCELFRVKRPSKDKYIEIVDKQKHCFPPPFQCYDKKTNHIDNKPFNELNFDTSSIVNIKELNIINKKNAIPDDISNVISNILLKTIMNPNNVNINKFRNDIYDLLIYNIDIQESFCYILFTLIKSNIFKSDLDINDTIIKFHTFIKYYNNNYRPIYHLESMFFYIINKIHFN